MGNIHENTQKHNPKGKMSNWWWFIIILCGISIIVRLFKKIEKKIIENEGI